MKLIDRIIKSRSGFSKKYVVCNEIRLSEKNLISNIKYLESVGTKIIPVLKSNAYGHGLKEIAQLLNKSNSDIVCVDGYFEVLEIRDIFKKDILVLGYIKKENYQNINTNNFSFVVHDLEILEELIKLNKRMRIHIELNTGMNRHGIKVLQDNFDELIGFIDRVGQSKLEIEGVMSHYYDADNIDNSDLDAQVKLFDKAVKLILNKKIKPKYIHIANSSGLIKSKSKYANYSRSGIAIYGINPLNKNDEFFSEYQNNLKPVLELSSEITKIIRIKKGESVSYGRTFIADKEIQIGVIPMGYFEGIPRVLSNKGFVKINNKFYKIAGKICMNHTMINLEDNFKMVKVGDRVVIISSDPQDKNSLSNICTDFDLFSYEVLVKLNESVRRVVI